jgi:hypothetical protein
MITAPAIASHNQPLAIFNTYFHIDFLLPS